MVPVSKESVNKIFKTSSTSMLHIPFPGNPFLVFLGQSFKHWLQMINISGRDASH